MVPAKFSLRSGAFWGARETRGQCGVSRKQLRSFEALERCFELYRKGNKGVSTTESDELESFSLFIALFRKQQDSILFESFGSGKGRGITA